jgi:hypothetical protein
LCGAPFAVIDHINEQPSLAGSNDPKNLQLLCTDCHNKKTRESFVQVSAIAEVERRLSVMAKALDLDERISAATPLRICDDHVHWPSNWRRIQSDRRKQQRMG